MGACWSVIVVVVAGCGFQVTITSDAASGAAVPDADPVADSDAALDAMVDGPWTTAACPTSYITIESLPSRYRLITTAADVLAQHAACMQDGAHLAVIDSVEEARDLSRFIDDSSGLPTNGNVLVYIGSVQRSNQNSVSAGWISATGAFNGSFWESGEPNDGFGVENDEEQFAVIWKQNDLLADVDNRSLPALCECDGLAITAEYEAVLVEAAN